MRVALLTLPDDAASWPDRAVLDILTRQVAMAGDLRCDRVLLMTEKPHAFTVGVQREADARGMAFRTVADPHLLATAVGRDNVLIGMAPGLLIEADRLNELPDEPFVMTIPADVDEAAERIDAARRWAGLFAVRGLVLDRLSCLTDNFAPLSATVRAALIENVPMRSMTGEGWHRIDRPESLTAYLRSRIRAGRDVGFIGRRIIDPLARMAMNNPQLRRSLGIAILFTLVLALAALFGGLPLLALAICLPAISATRVLDLCAKADAAAYGQWRQYAAVTARLVSVMVSIATLAVLLAGADGQWPLATFAAFASGAWWLVAARAKHPLSPIFAEWEVFVLICLACTALGIVEVAPLVLTAGPVAILMKASYRANAGLTQSQ